MTLLSFALSIGCGADAIEALASLPLEPGVLVATYPPDRSVRVGGDVPVVAMLGADAAGSAPTVHWQEDEREGRLSCALDYDGVYADCGVIDDIEPRSDSLALTWTLGNETATASTTPTPPDAAEAWDLYGSAELVALGGGGAAADLIAGDLSGGHLVAVLEEWEAPPHSGVMVVGPADATEADGILQLAPPGMTLVLDGEVGERGELAARADAAWLPVIVEGEWVQVLIVDISLTGLVGEEAVGDLRLDAVLPAISLLMLASPLGDLGEELVGLVELDVDRDGDGVAESASLVMEGVAPSVQLAEWTAP